MTAAFFSRRDLSVGDAPIGPTILDLKYVSVSETNVVGVQQVNPGFNVDQDIDQKLCTGDQDRRGSNVGSKEPINRIPYAQVISSL